MIEVISRSTHDDFTFNLFNNLVINLDCEAYYVWTNPTYKFEQFIRNTKFTKSTIIIGIKDLLVCNYEYHFWNKTSEHGVDLLTELANKNQDKNFIIFSSLENLCYEFSNIKNIQIIPWGGDITNQSLEYPNITPVVDKNFNSNKTFINLNRNYRHHRITLVSYLAEQGYLLTGNVSFLNTLFISQYADLLEIMPWEFNIPQHNDIRTKILNGYQKVLSGNNLLNNDTYNQVYASASNNLTDNDNFKNFNNSLRLKYQNSFVEIVSESSFEAPTFMITEKFLNSVYGCNFPILLSGVGAVAHLREVGFDTYDDIVDHSHDDIANPVDRLISAVENNRQLLLDTEYVKQVWKDNQHRFIKNVNFAKKGMYDWFESRARNKFNVVVANLNK